jgi:hypothetical protein
MLQELLPGLTSSGKRLNLYKPALHIVSNLPCGFVGIEKRDYSYRIIDVTGKITVSNEISVNSENEILEINSRGVYFLCLKSS